MAVTPEIIALLVAAGALAGFVDAIAGGGGLVTVPALAAAGFPPVVALAINKVQSCCGTATACLAYARAGHVELRRMAWPLAGVVVGAGLGAVAIQRLDRHVAAAVVPLLLLAATGYFLFSPRVADVERRARLGIAGFAAVAAGIGFYDGFFGPGTGAFFALALVSLLGLGLVRATAHAKLLNLASNLVSVAVFAYGGKVSWGIGLAMAAGNMTGAWIGAHSALRFGARLIRPLLVAISLALTARLLLDPDNPLMKAIWR